MSEEQISTDIQKSKTAIEKLDEHGNRPLLPRVVVEIPRVACTGETRLNLRPCFELPAFRRQPFRLPPRNGTGLNGKGPSTNGSQPEPSSRSWAERQTACNAPLDFLAYRFRESVKLTFNIVLVGDLATVSRQRFSQYFERWCPKEEKLDAWHKLLKKMDEAGITFAPGNDTELSED